jgi:small subunit ribosomal protein S21
MSRLQIGLSSHDAAAPLIKEHQLQVFVRDNNVDQALRVLKKQRRSYEKPSERKNRQKSEAIRRARKAARKQAQRDGLIPDTRKKKLLDGRKDGQRPELRRLPSI